MNLPMHMLAPGCSMMYFLAEFRVSWSTKSRSCNADELRRMRSTYCRNTGGITSSASTSRFCSVVCDTVLQL